MVLFMALSHKTTFLANISSIDDQMLVDRIRGMLRMNIAENRSYDMDRLRSILIREFGEERGARLWDSANSPYKGEIDYTKKTTGADIHRSERKATRRKMQGRR